MNILNSHLHALSTYFIKIITRFIHEEKAAPIGMQKEVPSLTFLLRLWDPFQKDSLRAASAAEVDRLPVDGDLHFICFADIKI